MKHRTEDNWIGALVIAATLILCAVLAAGADESHDHTHMEIYQDVLDFIANERMRIEGSDKFLLDHGHDALWCLGNCGNALGDVCQHICVANVIAGHHPHCPKDCGG